MIAILSPAKTLDFETKYDFSKHTIPEFMQDSACLVTELKKINSKGLSKLMNLSTSLSELNFDRYQSWNTDFNTSNARQSLLCFKGGVYVGLDVSSFSKNDLNYSQDCLRILSGLHGLLKPLDLIKPYRLEMGTQLINKNGKNLYEFWGDKITKSLNNSLKKNDSKYLVNLASNEYFKSVLPNKINAEIIDVKFLDKKNDIYKVISFFAKKARGSMASFLIKNKIKTLHGLKDFSGLGYAFDPSRSGEKSFCFIR